MFDKLDEFGVVYLFRNDDGRPLSFSELMPGNQEYLCYLTLPR